MKRNRQNNEPKEMVSFDGYKIFMKDEEGGFLLPFIHEKKKICNLLKLLKEKFNIKQEDFYQEAGMSSGTLSKMKRGDFIITKEGIIRLAYSIVSLVPQLNVHIRNHMEASPIYHDEANRYSLELIKELRTEFINTFGSTGDYLVNENLTIEKIHRLLTKSYNLYSSRKL